MQYDQTDNEIQVLFEQNSTRKQRLELIHERIAEKIKRMESLLDTIEESDNEEIMQDLDMMFWGL